MIHVKYRTKSINQPYNISLNIPILIETNIHMSTKNHKMLSLLVFAVILLSRRGGKAQSSGCSNNVISGLSSCIGYLRGNSSRPLPSCCTALANVEQSQPDCLCPMLSNGASFSLGIAANRTLAMALPTTCKLSTPQCHGNIIYIHILYY